MVFMEGKMVLRKEHFGSLLYDPSDWSLRCLSEKDAADFAANTKAPLISFNNPRRGYLSAPLKAFIAVSSRCNLGCRHCLISKKRVPGKELPFAALKDIFAQLGAMGVLEVRLGGFEPTMREDFSEIFDEAKRNNLSTCINTNGFCSDEVRKKLADSAVDRVHVSIDGLEKSHEYVRGKGTFKESIKTIRYLKKRGKYVRMATSLFKENRAEIPGLIRLCEEIGCDIKFAPISRLGSAEKMVGLLTPKDNEDLRKYFSSLEAKVNVFFNYGAMSPDFTDYCNIGDFESTMCGAGRTELRVENNGDVFMGGCGDIYSEFGPLGNCKDSFEKMWDRSQERMAAIMRDKGARCIDCGLKPVFDAWLAKPNPAFNFGAAHRKKNAESKSGGKCRADYI